MYVQIHDNYAKYPSYSKFNLRDSKLNLNKDKTFVQRTNRQSNRQTDRRSQYRHKTKLK